MTTHEHLADHDGCFNLVTADEFMDLKRYHPIPTHNGVVAWVTEHTKPDGKLGLKNVTFKIKAQVITETEEHTISREHYEKMMRAVRRSQRKVDKEMRAAGGGMGVGSDFDEQDHDHDHDEL